MACTGQGRCHACTRARHHGRAWPRVQAGRTGDAWGKVGLLGRDGQADPGLCAAPVCLRCHGNPHIAAAPPFWKNGASCSAPSTFIRHPASSGAGAGFNTRYIYRYISICIYIYNPEYNGFNHVPFVAGLEGGQAQCAHTLTWVVRPMLCMGLNI